MTKKITLLTLLFLSSILSFGQTNICDTIINLPDDDALVCDFYPTTNWATSEDYIFSGWTSGGTPLIFRALHKIDLSIIPINAVIQTAQLFLYYNNTSAHPQGNSYYPGTPYPTENSGSVYRINQNWTPNTLTWNNQPSYSSAVSVGIPATSSKTQNNLIDVKPLILDMIANPSTSFGLLLKINDETPYRTQLYASSNHPDKSLHPRLEICYQYPLNILDQQFDKEKIKLNLNQDHLQITKDAIHTIDKIELYNLTGQCIYAKRINKNSSILNFDLNMNLFKGVYIAKIYIENQILSYKLTN